MTFFTLDSGIPAFLVKSLRFMQEFAIAIRIAVLFLRLKTTSKIIITGLYRPVNSQKRLFLTCTNLLLNVIIKLKEGVLIDQG